MSYISLAQPRIMFGQQVARPSAQPGNAPSILFGKTEEDGFVSGGGGSGSKSTLLKRVGSALAAAAVGLGIISGVGGIRHEGPREDCVVIKKLNSNVEKNDKQGIFWAPPFGLSKTECFDMTPNRLTFNVPITPYGMSEMNLPLSLRIQPNADLLADSYVKGMDWAGGASLKKNNPNLAEEIGNDNNMALYANAFTEISRYVQDVTSQIPPEQLRSQAGKEALSDAIMNGYTPLTLFERFAHTVPDADKTKVEGKRATLSNKPVPSLQQEISKSFGGVDRLLILDVDPREATFKDPTVQESYNKAAKTQADQLDAREKIKLAQLEGQALIEAAKKQAEANSALAEGYDTPEEIAAAKAEILRKFAESGNSSYIGQQELDLTLQTGKTPK